SATASPSTRRQSAIAADAAAAAASGRMVHLRAATRVSQGAAIPAPLRGGSGQSSHETQQQATGLGMPAHARPDHRSRPRRRGYTISVQVDAGQLAILNWGAVYPSRADA